MFDSWRVSLRNFSGTTLLAALVSLGVPLLVQAQGSGDADFKELQKEFEKEGLKAVEGDDVITDKTAEKLKKRTQRKQEERRRKRELRKALAEKKRKAKRSREERVLYVGMGSLTPFIGESSKTETGEVSTTPLILMFNFAIGGRFQIIPRRTYFVPTWNYTPLGVSDFEGGAKARIMKFSMPLGYELLKMTNFALEARFGPGLMFYFISGGGGTVDLNNGNSTTTFYLPGLSSTSSMMILEAGLGFYVTKNRKFRLDMDAFISGVASDRRSLSASVSVHYGLL